MMKLSTIASLLLVGGVASQTICPTELTQSQELTDTLTLYYEVVDNVLCARMESFNEGWLGFGKMHPAEAIMGLPEEGSVLKYDLSAESESGVVPMSDDKQTLMDTNITQADGMTVMTFAKVLDEDQYPLVAGDNTCIYAESTSNAFGFHNNHPHYFVLKLADSSGSDATMKRGFMAIAFGAMAVWFGL